MKHTAYRISKVANGWILDPYEPQLGGMAKWDEIHVFPSSKELAKFIKKLDEDEKFIEATK